MNDFTNLDKTIVRELSCRLCLCNDIVKLKPLSAELKRKLKKLFNITVRLDDFLPKAICHDCSQQVSALYLYSVKVEKNQKFLSHYEHKRNILKQINSPTVDNSCPLSPVETNTPKEKEENKQEQHSMSKSNVITTKQQDSIETKSKGKKSSPQVQYLEAMSLDEFSELESVDKSFLIMKTIQPRRASGKTKSKKIMSASKRDNFKSDEVIDPIVLVDGKPAKQGAELDKQISLFYKMECFICHEDGFKFKSLMTHYKDRHGVPGYVACCEKKFHYFYPKKIIEHMAYHLQPNIFSCPSCHTNFQTSNELNEHRINGGRSDGKIICPRCSERYPTYHELGVHIVAHRTDTLQCDYCGKTLKHHHRKKTVNHMEDLILCSQCLRLLKNIEKQEKEKKEKSKETTHTINARKINSTTQKIRQAMGLEVDGEANKH